MNAIVLKVRNSAGDIIYTAENETDFNLEDEIDLVTRLYGNIKVESVNSTNSTNSIEVESNSTKLDINSTNSTNQLIALGLIPGITIPTSEAKLLVRKIGLKHTTDLARFYQIYHYNKKVGKRVVQFITIGKLIQK